MTDMQISDNSLILENGDFVTITGIEELKQHIVVALNTFYKDWILDNTIGIDYPNGLKNNEFLEYDIQKQIKDVEGVQSVNDFTLELDRTDMTVNVTACIKTEYGSFDMNNKIQQ